MLSRLGFSRSAMHPPGFGVLAAAQGLLFFAVWRNAQRHARIVLLGFLSFSYVGLAYLLSLLAGTLRTVTFWPVFGACLAILTPIIALAHRLLLRDRN